MRCDRVWINARLATLDPARDGLGEVDHGVIAALDGRIAYAGARADAPAFEAAEIIDCEGRWITPGLIDPHTHLVFAARALADCRSIDIRTTLLGAHALPPEFKGDPDGYIDLVCKQMIPAVADAKLAEAVDEFCEGIGFTLAQTRRVFQAAHARGLKIKVHAEQLSNQNGAALAAEFWALSADHLEHLDQAGVEAVAAAGMVATLLPGAFYFTRGHRLPPIDALRAAGVPMALATDCNPGTSPLTSPLLVMNMAATLFRMTVEECLAGVTREAARALGLSNRGVLRAGKACDLAIWDIERPAELVYRMGFNPLHARVWKGH